MDERLKQLFQNLGNAINESLSNSERIAEAIKEIKIAGYDIFLVLEATIAYCKEGEDSEESSAPLSELEKDSSGKPAITEQDEKFLHSLKIRLDG